MVRDRITRTFDEFGNRIDDAGDTLERGADRAVDEAKSVGRFVTTPIREPKKSLRKQREITYNTAEGVADNLQKAGKGAGRQLGKSIETAVTDPREALEAHRDIVSTPFEVGSDQVTDPRKNTRRAIGEDFTPNERKEILDTGGFLSEDEKEYVRKRSQQVSQNINRGAEKYGGIVQEATKYTTGAKFNPLVDQETQEQASENIGRVAEGTAKGAGEAVNVYGAIDSADTVARVADDAGTLARNPQKTLATTAIVGSQVGRTAGDFAIQNPAYAAGAVGGTIGTSIGGGAAGKVGFIKSRDALATRGLDFQGKVDIEDIERPDVRQGSGLTRLSERSAPDGGLAMSTDEFPVQTADRPVDEIQNLAREFDDPRIREALGAGPEEDVVYRAVGGIKGTRYEPRSRRPYDPDATFLAPSVARNFLDLDGTTEGITAGGMRLPRVGKAVSSLNKARKQEGTPNVIATAGEIKPLPEDVSTLAERTRFLQANRNTDTLYAPSKMNQQTVTGESEVFLSAEGAESTEPMTFRGKYYDPDEIAGTGEVRSGETTELIRVSEPYYTEINGETVPIQIYRQNTGEYDIQNPTTTRDGLEKLQQDINRFINDESAEGSLVGGSGRSATDSTDDFSSDVTYTEPYQPGGAEGVPIYPRSPSVSSGVESATASITDTDSIYNTGSDITSTVGTPTDLESVSYSDLDRDTDGIYSGFDEATDVDLATTPIYPSTPEDPTDPTPTDPDDPSTPTTPTPPEDPTDPTPTDPDDPSTPTTPTPPEDPDTPIIPDTPDTPNTPNRVPEDESEEDDEFIEFEGFTEINKLINDTVATADDVFDEDSEVVADIELGDEFGSEFTDDIDADLDEDFEDIF